MDYHDDNQFERHAFDWEIRAILKEKEANMDIEMAHAKLDRALMTYLEDSGQEKVAVAYRNALEEIGFIRLLL